jgi:hypothetical protein
MFIPVLEHGSEKHRMMTLDHLLEGLLEFAINEQGAKSVTKALKEGGMETLDKVVRRMCEPAKGYSILAIPNWMKTNSLSFQCSPRHGC